MDLKGLSWIGNMCQKIESLCTEVEETMYPDTVKYVEDQMQTIGETFKKIYSDVVHDFQPPSSANMVEAKTPPSSSDTLKAETPRITVVHNADGALCNVPKVKFKKSLNNEAEQMLKNSDDAANNDNIVTHELSCPAICSVNKPCSMKEQCVAGNIDCQCADLYLSNRDCFAAKDMQQRHYYEYKAPPETPRLKASMTEDSGEEFAFSDERNGSDESVSGLRDVGSESSSVGMSHSAEDGVGVSDEVTEGNYSVCPGAAEGGNSKTTVPSCWSMSGLSDEISYPMAASKIGGGDADYHGTLFIEQFEEVNLEESCVLVDKKESYFRLPVRDEQKSYKKKISDVFFTRRRSKGQRDKDQLAMWHREQSGRNLLPSSLVQEGVHDSQSDISSESDWELV